MAVCALCGSTHNAERSFPILNGGNGVSIPWRVVVPHARQAERNHYQSLERLAERGGLSWSEMAAVLQDREWRKMDDTEAREVVMAICAPDPTIQSLRAALAAKEEEVARLRELVKRLSERPPAGCLRGSV